MLIKSEYYPPLVTQLIQPMNRNRKYIKYLASLLPIMSRTITIFNNKYLYIFVCINITKWKIMQSRFEAFNLKPKHLAHDYNQQTKNTHNVLYMLCGLSRFSI